MAFIVVYDACVLYPAAIRDLLIRLARTGHFRAKWTNEILDECFEAILETRADLNEAALARTRELMVKAVPDSVRHSRRRLAENQATPARVLPIARCSDGIEIASSRLDEASRTEGRCRRFRACVRDGGSFEHRSW